MYLKLRFYELIIHKIYIYHRRKFVIIRNFVKLINKLRRLGLRTRIKSIFQRNHSKSQKFDWNLTASGLTYENSENSHLISVQPQTTELDPKKVGVCIGSLGHGGAEKQWLLLAAGLKALGYAPIFIIQQNLNHASAKYVEFLNDQEINIVSISDLRDYSNISFEDTYVIEQKYFSGESLQQFNKLYNNK